MKRRHLFELEDLRWWPRSFRDRVTEYLVAAQQTTRMYQGFAPRLAAAIRRSNADRIVDLCSGAGGPWQELLPSLRAEGLSVSLCLTDKYPNTRALARVASHLPGVQFEMKPVNATDVPAELTGFRTLFTSFHHFGPAEAQQILKASVRDRQGIAIIEATARTPAALAMMALVPVTVWLLTPRIQPFRWSRLLWTYLLPVVPATVLFDGFISCLRTYQPDEMLALARAAGGDVFDWEAGTERPAGCPFPLPYLIGTPRGALSD